MLGLIIIFHPRNGVGFKVFLKKIDGFDAELGLSTPSFMDLFGDIDENVTVWYPLYNDSDTRKP